MGSPLHRALLLLAVSLFSALLLLGRQALPDLQLSEGDVVPRDLRASTTFEFLDRAATETRQEAAAAGVPLVFDFDAAMAVRLQDRVSSAFDLGRRRYQEALGQAREAGRDAPVEDRLRSVGADFLHQLGLTLSAEEVEILLRRGFDQEIEQVANELIGRALRRYVVADSSLVPPKDHRISVIRTRQRDRDEVALEDGSSVRTPDQVRQSISLYALEHFEEGEQGERIRAAVAIARAAVRPNFSYDQILTEQRRQAARDQVLPVIQQVPRGTTIVRKGDVVGAQEAAMLEAVRSLRGDRGFWRPLGSLLLFCLLLYGTVYRFAASLVRRFSTATGPLATLAGLAVMALLVARLVVDLSGPISAFAGGGLGARATWFLVPVAGFTLLVRVLLNSETALIYAVVLSGLCGMMMEQQAGYTLYFVVSSVTAAAALGHDRDRRAILRAGLVTGVFDVAFVLVFSLVQAHMVERPLLGGTEALTLWSALFGLVCGPLSAFLALALVPLFELFGFVTDLRLMELANLNHPLLRNLMLRAPGTYHHSVMVGTLAEAAAEAVGSNALLARVASYFHDIGKAVTPEYFVENQRGGPNPHDRLSPEVSARVIVDHVRNGGAIAREHKLPQPIIDNIYMHHGTGLLHWFHSRALAQDPGVEEGPFRYPGPRPDSREAGIIHLADKVEAACRTIREPTPERVSAMIQKIINSVLADGQFRDCPLTVREIFTIAGVFREVILAIHHERIEYPETAAISGGPTPAVPPQTVITLELNRGEVLPERGVPVDYESADVLPDDPLGGPPPAAGPPGDEPPSR